MSVTNEMNHFVWEDMGDVEIGRPRLGQMVPVEIYRLLKFTMHNVLVAEVGANRADDLLQQAGNLAGHEFVRQWLDLDQDIEDFLDELSERMLQKKLGILLVEKLDRQTMTMTLTIQEDLDCSGVTVSQQTLCNFDEGFIAGALEEFTGDAFVVKEIDCWANGAQLCRFAVYRLS